MTAPEFPELGFYALAGQPASSRDVPAEVREGEAMGLGTAVFASRGVERGDELPATMARSHATHALEMGAEEFLD